MLRKIKLKASNLLLIKVLMIINNSLKPPPVPAVFLYALFANNVGAKRAWQWVGEELARGGEGPAQGGEGPARSDRTSNTHTRCSWCGSARRRWLPTTLLGGLPRGYANRLLWRCWTLRPWWYCQKEL